MPAYLVLLIEKTNCCLIPMFFLKQADQSVLVKLFIRFSLLLQKCTVIHDLWDAGWHYFEINLFIC
jgi:hypothetical protein